MLVAPGFDPIDFVDQITPTPTFFITGTADRICDPRQTRELHAAAGEPKSLWTIDGGGHVGALTDPDINGQDKLDEFFSHCVETRQTIRASTSPRASSSPVCPHEA